MELRTLVEKVKSSDVKSMELCQKAIDKIQAEDTQYNSILEISQDWQQKAEAIDKNPKGKLAGIPIVVKDNFCVKNFKATAGSKILGNFKPPYTAHCIERLEKEGAIVIAKANMDEFAMGSSNENSAFGVCKNPCNTDTVPGGSSGGSAAAVAAGFSSLAIGSDTGGSIRQPASFCGVVGIKPTYGSISRYGMIAFASSLDQAGPLARSVDDASLALEVMIDKDSRDETNVICDFDFQKPMNEKYRLGVPKEYLKADLSEDIRSQLQATLQLLKDQGHQLVEIELPHTEYAIPVYYLVAASEASSNLSRYDGVRYGLRDISVEGDRKVSDLKQFYKLTRSRGFGEEVKRRILLGTFALSAGYYDAYYTKACQVRRLISEDFIQAFQKCDFILGPVSTSTAFKIGEKVQDPVSMYYNDILTTPANLAGLPAMSLPIGLDSQGLPIGLQMIAPAFQDDKMVGFARTIEKLANLSEESHG